VLVSLLTDSEVPLSAVLTFELMFILFLRVVARLFRSRSLVLVVFLIVLSFLLLLYFHFLGRLGAFLIGAIVTFFVFLLALFVIIRLFRAAALILFRILISIFGSVLIRIIIFLFVIKYPLGAIGLSFSKVIAIVVDRLNLEASCVIGLEGWKATIRGDLEGTGLTLRQSDIDGLRLTNLIKVEGRRVTTVVSFEGTHSLGKSGVSIGA
jgi:hypothetical protein